jgi:hypothetical protein
VAVLNNGDYLVQINWRYEETGGGKILLRIQSNEVKPP